MIPKLCRSPSLICNFSTMAIVWTLELIALVEFLTDRIDLIIAIGLV